jgi:4-nitrophenyl phosphatase
MERELTYKKMAKANAFIREGAVFVGTNPDSSFPTTGGLAPGAGSIIAAIAVASGVEPTIMGKPHTTMFKMAIEKLNVKPEEAVSIGDRLDTDILGGKRAGLRTALVMTGATREKDLINNTIYPDLVSPDLTTLVGL